MDIGVGYALFSILSREGNIPDAAIGILLLSKPSSRHRSMAIHDAGSDHGVCG